MSQGNEFRYLLEEVRVFHRNLNKDNVERKTSEEVTRRKLRKLDKFKDSYKQLVELFNRSDADPKIREEIKAYTVSINKYFEGIKYNLESRLVKIRTEQAEHSEGNLSSIKSDIKTDSTDSDCSDESENMSEKFDLRTAAGLLPVMDGTENTTKQLIDAIELYDALLDAAGKKLLTTYVLKTRLSQSAKIRLNSAYTTNVNLVDDLRNYFITKKSVPFLSVQLSSAKQNGKSVEEFGKTIEELMVDLTITQADGNENVVTILREVNEKLAIHSFANGLQNQDLRTIIKARNYNRLNEAIQGAKDEVLPKRDAQVFHIRGRQNFRPGQGSRFFRGSNFGNRSANPYRGNKKFSSSSGNLYQGNYNNRGFTRGYERNCSRRGNFSRNNQVKGFFANTSSEPLDMENQYHSPNTTDQFFRVSNK